MSIALWARPFTLLLVFATSCGDDPPDPIGPNGPGPVDTVGVFPTEASLVIGDTVHLLAQAQDSAGAIVTDAAFTWTSNPASIASVASTGVVTGHAAGEATVTVTSAGHSANAVITVIHDLASVSIDPDSAEIVEGDSVRLTGVGLDSNGDTVPTLVFSWESANPDVASVDPAGLVTGEAEGVTIVTGTAGELEAQATISVLSGAPALVSVEITPGNTDVFVDGTVQFSAVGIDALGDSVLGLEFEWASSNEAVASIDQDGLLTAHAEGDTEVYVSSAGLADTAAVGVLIPVEGDFNEPAGFEPIVIRPFDSIALTDGDRGTGELPEKQGGSEGWDGVESRYDNLTAVVAPADPLSPGGAMRFTYPVGHAQNSGPGVAQTVGLGSHTELYVRTSVRLGPTYYAGSVSNKMYFHRMSGAPRGEPFLALHANNDGETFRLAVNFQGTPDNGRGFVFADAPANAIERERWYIFETLLIMNSAEGVGDGVFRLWVDGELVVDLDDLEIRPVGSTGQWGTLHVSPTYGGDGAPNENEFYWELGHAYISGRN